MGFLCWKWSSLWLRFLYVFEIHDVIYYVVFILVVHVSFTLYYRLRQTLYLAFPSVLICNATFRSCSCWTIRLKAIDCLLIYKQKKSMAMQCDILLYLFLARPSSPGKELPTSDFFGWPDNGYDKNGPRDICISEYWRVNVIYVLFYLSVSRLKQSRAWGESLKKMCNYGRKPFNSAHWNAKQPSMFVLWEFFLKWTDVSWRKDIWWLCSTRFVGLRLWVEWGFTRLEVSSDYSCPS